MLLARRVFSQENRDRKSAGSAKKASLPYSEDELSLFMCEAKPRNQRGSKISYRKFHPFPVKRFQDQLPEL